MTTLRAELDEAQRFIGPAWSSGNDDVVVRLSNEIDTSSNSDPQNNVLKTALGHLLRIHEADIVQQEHAAPRDGEGDYDEESRKTLYGLLDLLAIRGIVPSLSPGVAAKHRPTSMIPSLRGTASSGKRDLDLLCEIVDGLSRILEKPAAGLAPMIRERILTDALAGAGELAFCPGLSDNLGSTYENVFAEMVNKTPISSALPLLTYLMQPTTPPWLKSQLSKQLSLIPLRPRGVRHTIEFIASSYPQQQPPSDTQDRSVQNKGPSLPLDALTQASKLLSSVPSSMEADQYFTALAPQLLTLLDGADGPELSKAAALIIGSGILGKRALGAPGAIGWRLFAEPLLSSINPPVDQAAKKQGATIVSEQDLKLALSRLITLLTSRPSPGLTKRLLARLMLPLWSLLDYAKARPVDRLWRDAAWKLLETYFRLGAGAEQLEALAVNLLWDGPPTWAFAPGSDGGIEVRHREQSAAGDDGFNVIEQMGKIEQRLATYHEILTSNGVEDQDIGDLFVRLSKRWLVPRSSAAAKPSRLEVSAEEDPLQSLIIAKLVMAILENFKDKLAADPDNMIELVKHLLDEWTESEMSKKKRADDLRRATYAGLGNIVQQHNTAAHQNNDATAPAEVASSDVLPVALSLLNTLLSATNFRPTTQTSSTLSAILPTISSLRNPDVDSNLPPSVSMTAANLTTRISTLLNISKPTTRSSKDATTPTTTLQDQQTLQTALQDLTSPTPPVRASALSAITTLARSSSPVLDIPQLTLLLLRTALPDIDDYVQLHALSTLTALHAIDPLLVGGTLLTDAFVDAAATAVGPGGLDARLRVGEALGRIVQDTQEALSPLPSSSRSQRQTNLIASTARTVIDKITAAAVRVASRRGNPARAAELAAHRQRDARLARQKDAKKKRAAAATTESGPSMLSSIVAPPETDSDASDEEAENDPDAATLASIVAGWSATEPNEEDLRLRAMALAVLGRALEHPTTLAALPHTTIASGVEVAVGSLAVESDEAHAVVRRSAVMVVWGLVRGLDAVHEDGEVVVAEGAGLGAERWEEVERVVGWARDLDSDVVVKGHAGEVVEALGTWRVKKALGVRGDGSVAADVHVTDDLGLAGLRGLNVKVDDGGADGMQRSRRRFVIEEVE